MKSSMKIRGWSFYPDVEIKKGDTITLKHEPWDGNDKSAADPGAIACYKGNQRCGSVARNETLRPKLLSRIRKQGHINLPVSSTHEPGPDEKLQKTFDLEIELADDKPKGDWRSRDIFLEERSFTGEDVLWSEFAHEARSLDGKLLVGGSTYAKQFDKPFESHIVAGRMPTTNNRTPQDWIAYWDDMSTMSAEYGTAVHKGVEFYFRHLAKFGHDEALSRIPHLREAVERFLEVVDLDTPVPEPFITDVEMGMSGWIDILNVHHDTQKICSLIDHKTSTFKEGKYQEKWFGTVSKRTGKQLKPGKLEIYFHQLNYYAQILMNAGWTVNDLTISHWHEGKWNLHTQKAVGVKDYERP